MNMESVESGMMSAPQPAWSPQDSKVKRLKVFAGVLNAMLAASGGLALGMSYIATDSARYLLRRLAIICFCSILNFIVYFLLVRLLFRVTRGKRSIAQVKKTILSITLTKIIDDELQQQFIIDKIGQIVNRLDVQRRIVDFCKSDEFSTFVARHIHELQESSALFAPNDLWADSQGLIESLREMCLRDGFRIVPAAIAVFVKDAFVSNERFHNEVRTWVRRQLDDLSSDVISRQMYAVLETKRIEFALSGNIAGALFALIIFFTARLHRV